MARHDLVDRLRLDHPDSSPSVRVRSYLDRVLVKRADTDFVKCPTFHYVAWSDHKLVKVSLWLAD